MSWKAGLSRHLSLLRFFACPDSPSSRGVMTWYTRYYDELKLLNPNFSLLMRTVENAMPAVTTELQFTTPDVVRFMIQTGRLSSSNDPSRLEAAQDYLKTDWDRMRVERFKSPGFDPERPYLDPDEWTDARKHDLQTYLRMKSNLQEQLDLLTKNDTYTRAENALLMTQRVDLWCAGPKEVERAVQHLYRLAKAKNSREVDFPSFIVDFIPGQDDMEM